MVRLLLTTLLLVVSSFVFSQKQSSVKEYKKSFTTYPYSDPDPVPDFSKIYPYFRFDGFTDKPSGLAPTLIVRVTEFVLPSITDTVLLARLAT